MQNLHLHVYFLYSIIFTMFYRVPLSYTMLTLICYRIVDEEAIYITMYFTYMYLFLYFCMYFNLQGTSYLIFIFFFSLPSKCLVLIIKIKTLYIKYCTWYENKLNHESWLLKHVSSSLEMIWSHNYIFFFLK